MRRPIAPQRQRSRLPSVPTLAAIIGVAGLATVWLLVEPPDATPPAPAQAPAPASAPAKVGPGPIVKADPAPAPAARTPAGGAAILPAPDIAGPLTRVPRAPPPPAPATAPEPLTLRRVQVDAPGQIRADRQTIRLAGIRAPTLDRVCTDGSGKRWPCGVQSRSALRAFIGPRQITCTPPVPVAGGRPDETEASCAVGTHDLAEWLVRQGWAEPGDDAPEGFAALADQARTDGLGLWQGAPTLHAPIKPERTMPEAIGTPVPVEADAPVQPMPPAETPAEGPPLTLMPGASR